MAIKGREELQCKPFSLLTMIILFAIILGYTFLYNRVIANMDDFQLKTAIGIAALSVMVIAFLVALRFISTRYELLLTHDRLTITRKIFFWTTRVGNIKLQSITDILPVEKMPKILGKTQNFTLTNTEGKRKYAVLYEEQGKICCVKLQCSGKFYELIKKQVKIK